MTNVRTSVHAALFVLLSTVSSSSQPFDCEKLKRTTMPYQVTFVAPDDILVTPDGTARHFTGGQSFLQVYRDKEGFAVEYGIDYQSANREVFRNSSSVRSSRPR